jgi:membrane protein implicated in regulation of membrane protease activity
MILIAAILLALYVVDRPWEVVIVAAAACIEVAQTGFWLWWTKRRRPQVGAEALVGALGAVVQDCAPTGLVRVHGELWRAHCVAGARTGERVRVRAIEGLVLEVEPAASS